MLAKRGTRASRSASTRYSAMRASKCRSSALRCGFAAKCARRPVPARRPALTDRSASPAPGSRRPRRRTAAGTAAFCASSSANLEVAGELAGHFFRRQLGRELIVFQGPDAVAALGVFDRPRVAAVAEERRDQQHQAAARRSPAPSAAGAQRLRSRAASASSTSCTLAKRSSGLTARQRSMISASARSTPRTLAMLAGQRRGADRMAIAGQPLFQIAGRVDLAHRVVVAMRRRCRRASCKESRPGHTRPTARRARPPGRPAPGPCRTACPGPAFARATGATGQSRPAAACRPDRAGCWPASGRSARRPCRGRGPGRRRFRETARPPRARCSVPCAPQQVVERAVLDVLHHVVRRLGVPADVEELHDVAIGRKEAQLLDFARQQRPIDAAAVQRRT